MNESDFRKLAVNTVVSYFNSTIDTTDVAKKIDESDVYVVWMVKVLQNNKCLISTSVPDGIYYEFTWNGDSNEGYLDVYKKWTNCVIRNTNCAKDES